MDYRKSPIVHVPLSLIIQMPELRVHERPLLPGRVREEPEEAGQGGWGSVSLRMAGQRSHLDLS